MIGDGTMAMVMNGEDAYVYPPTSLSSACGNNLGLKTYLFSTPVPLPPPVSASLFVCRDLSFGSTSPKLSSGIQIVVWCPLPSLPHVPSVHLYLFVGPFMERTDPKLSSGVHIVVWCTLPSLSHLQSVHLSLFVGTFHSAALAQNCRLMYKLSSSVPSHPSPTSRLCISICL